MFPAKLKRFVILAMLLAFCGGTLAPCIAHAEESAKEPAKKEEKKDKGEGGDKKSDKDVSGGRFAGDPVYVHLAPMILPVITEKGSEQIVTLAITLELKDFDAADDVHTNMPRVMDAIMRVLYGGLGNGDLRNGQLVDVDRIKLKATNAIGEVVGPDNIKNVLIEAIAQRRL